MCIPLVIKVLSYFCIIDLQYDLNNNKQLLEPCTGKTQVFIRKYGSTFYIGIAMVVLPYIGLWEN